MFISYADPSFNLQFLISFHATTVGWKKMGIWKTKITKNHFFFEKSESLKFVFVREKSPVFYFTLRRRLLAVSAELRRLNPGRPPRLGVEGDVVVAWLVGPHCVMVRWRISLKIKILFKNLFFLYW